MIKCDTYHDTWTNYLMEQEPLLIQDQSDGDGCYCCCQDKRRWEKKMSPPGLCSSQSYSWYSMSRTCGPRDIISLIIPRLGDNKAITPIPNALNAYLKKRN